MTDDANRTTGAVRRTWFNLRVVLLLAGLLIVICASVIATDLLSRRDRQVAPATTIRN
jgi:hypothetical protein